MQPPFFPLFERPPVPFSIASCVSKLSYLDSCPLIGWSFPLPPRHCFDLFFRCLAASLPTKDRYSPNNTARYLFVLPPLAFLFFPQSFQLTALNAFSFADYYLSLSTGRAPRRSMTARLNRETSNSQLLSFSSNIIPQPFSSHWARFLLSFT